MEKDSELFNKKGMTKKEITYKEAFARLEEIQALIESNKLDVDDLSEKLKEASGLLKICKDKLFLANEETKKILEEIK
jgi:exodeoxyribonuclease VII small subunit